MSFPEKAPISVSKELRHALILHRIRAGIAAQRPVVSRASIDEVERALQVALPAEILAVFAATCRDPYEIIVLTDEARELDDLPVGLVAVALARAPSKASQLPVYWCYDASSAQGGSACEMIRWTSDPDDRRYRLSVLDLVRACYLGGRPTEEEQIAIRGLAAKFRPMVVSEPRAPFRRVVHHRFGPGFVLREFYDGTHKVEVEFPSVGVKLLLASYVQDAPSPTSRARRRAS
jgi:hypothetical protein